MHSKVKKFKQNHYDADEKFKDFLKSTKDSVKRGQAQNSIEEKTTVDLATTQNPSPLATQPITLFNQKFKQAEPLQVPE